MYHYWYLSSPCGCVVVVVGGGGGGGAAAAGGGGGGAAAATAAASVNYITNLTLFITTTMDLHSRPFSFNDRVCLFTPCWLWADQCYSFACSTHC